MTEQGIGTSQEGAQGRRRSDKSHKAILHAALALLEQEGYRALTIEAIAARAGVGKQTIYRWWPSKAAIVLEAFTLNTSFQIPQPTTGSLDSDLEQFLTASRHAYTEKTGQILRSLMSEALLDAEFAAQFYRTFIQSRRDALTGLLTAAVQRHELPPDTNINFLLDLVYGAIWYRVLLQHADMNTEEFMLRLQDMILRYRTPRPS